MPEWAQWLTYAVPPRYFNEIMRAVYLKRRHGGRTTAQVRVARCLRGFLFVYLQP